MKKLIALPAGISAFLVFFCWGFPALKGAQVNWLQAILAFVAFTVVGVLVSALSSGALNHLFETGGKVTTYEKEKKEKNDP